MNAPQPYASGSPYEVQDSAEFRRVLNLPRRDWEERITYNDLYLRMTQAFKMPQGAQALRPIQAAGLADAHDYGGLFAPIRVGEGKTLLSYLLPTVIPNVRRPTLLVSAALIEKTWREFQILRQHWVSHPAFMTRAAFDEAVISYEILGRTSGKDKLMQRRPDMVVADECHRLRNRQAACTKRVERFMIANPTTIFCGMSGTITKRSIKDYWHLLYWSLRERMPLPRAEAEMEKWAEALDEKKTEAIGRRSPGVLMYFCTEEEKATVPVRTSPVGRTQQMPNFIFREKLTAARKGYQRRLRETPGVICSSDENLDCSLLIRRLDVDPGPEVQSMIEEMRDTWKNPNGDEIQLPMELWRHARELACGFWYRWEPPPPNYWASARSTWHWTVRQVLDPEGIFHAKFSHLNLDSPAQVALAITGASYDVTDDDYQDGVEGLGWAPPPVTRHVERAPTITDPAIVKAYREWERVRNDYKINVVPQWVSDSVINYCLDWMKRNGPGIVWTEHRAFGERLADRLGTGFCSRRGVDANGRMIEDYNGAPVVASVQANHMGRNLQAWNRSLVVTAMPVGSLWEQLLGRTHRMGQEADTVYCDWICACDEQDIGFQQLLADARYIQETTGQSQKLLYADHV